MVLARGVKGLHMCGAYSTSSCLRLSEAAARLEPLTNIFGCSAASGRVVMDSRRCVQLWQSWHVHAWHSTTGDRHLCGGRRIAPLPEVAEPCRQPPGTGAVTHGPSEPKG